jgi:hypothetical protein
LPAHLKSELSSNAHGIKDAGQRPFIGEVLHQLEQFLEKRAPDAGGE